MARLYLFLIIIFFLFVSCGRQKQEVTVQKRENKETENRDTENRDTENSESENSGTENSGTENRKRVVLKSSEAGEYIGKDAEVTGFVADVVVRPKVIYLNFDKKYPKNTFTAVIFPSDADKFGDVEQFRNKNVTVSGKIGTYGGKPQIILNRKEQLAINN